jgi:RNA polymerase sigma-70 factor, ECF subfamily
VHVMADQADRQQLEVLYRSRFFDFVRIAAGVTGDADAAQDAVQEAFARALRALRDFRGDAPLEAWVWRIVLNAAFDRSRSLAPRPVAAPDASAEAVEDAPSSDFARWVGELPERQRLTVFLRYCADLDYRSIALVLGVEVGTVSATLHAAHERLKRLLEEVPR